MKPEFIIIHHSLTEDGKTVSWGAIRDYHVNVQKWVDVGYHYGIEMVGKQYEIFKGRMDDVQGAHCQGFNDESIGICRVGNFDIIKPDDAGQKLLMKLCRSLMNIYGIKRDHVLGHWETYHLRGLSIQKSCPGNKFSMPDFRRSL